MKWVCPRMKLVVSGLTILTADNCISDLAPLRQHTGKDAQTTGNCDFRDLRQPVHRFSPSSRLVLTALQRKHSSPMRSRQPAVFSLPAGIHVWRGPLTASFNHSGTCVDPEPVVTSSVKGQF